MKVKDISNYRLVDSKILNEFNRKSQIKQKSSHIRSSSSKSKMNSSLKISLLKKLMLLISLDSKNIHTDSGNSNFEESLKDGSRSKVVFQFSSII